MFVQVHLSPPCCAGVRRRRQWQSQRRLRQGRRAVGPRGAAGVGERVREDAPLAPRDEQSVNIAYNMRIRARGPTPHPPSLS
eukprot:scaffold77466_cov26-Tisochrysis_lutea.AAC.1